MPNYYTEFDNFNCATVSKCSFYNVGKNKIISVNLFISSNKLCLEYTVLKSIKVQGLTDYDTVANGNVEVPLTYTQLRKPTRKTYLSIIEKALENVIKEHLN